jgi:exosortase
VQLSRRALLLLLLAALWPVWLWSAARAVDGSDEPWGLLALATAALFVWRRRADPVAAEAPLGLAILLLALYAAAYPLLSPLPRALIAMSAAAAALSALCFGRRLHPALWGLLLLALPVTASLDFYLGYPLRALVGTATAALLQMNGFAVVPEGSLLDWSGRLISIDAPCSGVRMLWAGAYLALTLAAFQRLSAAKTALLCALAIAGVLAANVLRAAALFYLESGLLRLPGDWHAAVGVAVFLLAALTVADAARRIGKPAHEA